MSTTQGGVFQSYVCVNARLDLDPFQKWCLESMNRRETAIYRMSDRRDDDFVPGTNIQWNTHRISNLMVSGDEMNGFSVSLDINWKAKTYKGETYDINIHQDWMVRVDKSKNFVIEKHRAHVIDKQ